MSPHERRYIKNEREGTAEGPSAADGGRGAGHPAGGRGIYGGVLPACKKVEAALCHVWGKMYYPW